jgi:hypothetical protein
MASIQIASPQAPDQVPGPPATFPAEVDWQLDAVDKRKDPIIVQLTAVNATVQAPASMTVTASGSNIFTVTVTDPTQSVTVTGTLANTSATPDSETYSVQQGPGGGININPGGSGTPQLPIHLGAMALEAAKRAATPKPGGLAMVSGSCLDKIERLVAVVYRVHVCHSSDYQGKPHGRKRNQTVYTPVVLGPVAGYWCLFVPSKYAKKDGCLQIQLTGYDGQDKFVTSVSAPLCNVATPIDPGE